MDYEELLAKITELTNVVKENGGLNGLRREDLVADFEKLLDKQSELFQAAQPVRKGEGMEVPPYQVKGRYGRVLKSFADHGEARVNGTPIKPVDLLLAKRLMESAHLAQQAQGGIKQQAFAPSDDLVEAVKAMSSTGTNTGAEFVPENLAAGIWEDMFVASRVFADLPEQPMTSDPQDMAEIGSLAFAKGTQNTAATAQDLATAERTLTTTELLAEVNWSYSLDEDAVVAMMPTIRMEMTRAGAEYMDAFALNADATNAATGNINLDDDDPDDTAYYLSAGQDGLRHAFLVDAPGQGSNVNAAISDAGMTVILNKLGKYGLNPNDVRIVPDVQTYLAMLGLTNVSTVDKYGAAATIATGELAKYRGIPVIPSAVMPLTEADGKACKTAGSNVKGQIVTYNRLMWKRGQRRGLTIEIDRSIQKRQMIMVTSFRIAVGCRGARASIKHVTGGYNITL